MLQDRLQAENTSRSHQVDYIDTQFSDAEVIKVRLFGSLGRAGLPQWYRKSRSGKDATWEPTRSWALMDQYLCATALGNTLLLRHRRTKSLSLPAHRVAWNAENSPSHWQRHQIKLLSPHQHGHYPQLDEDYDAQRKRQRGSLTIKLPLSQVHQEDDILCPSLRPSCQISHRRHIWLVFKSDFSTSLHLEFGLLWLEIFQYEKHELNIFLDA